LFILVHAKSDNVADARKGHVPATTRCLCRTNGIAPIPATAEVTMNATTNRPSELAVEIINGYGIYVSTLING